MNAARWLALFALVSTSAHAQTTTPTKFTNLPIVCTEQKDLTGQPISACAYSNQKFLRATQTSWVRYCISSKGCTPTGDPATGTVAVWKRFDLISDLDFIEVCTVAKTPGDPVSGGGCPAAGEAPNKWGAMKYVGKPQVNKLPVMPPASFQVTPKEGVSPLKVTVAWNVPGMVGNTPCLAEGHPAWSGAKAASSKEEFTLYADAAFTLTCASIDTRHVLLTWRPPTLNTDGTVLTNLAYYTINYGNTLVDLKPALSGTIQVDKGAEHYIIENLKPDTWHFGMKSVNTFAQESELSNIVSYTTRVTTTPPVPRFTATEYVKVAVQPASPTGVQALEPQPKQLHEPNQLSVVEFAYVPVGTPCDLQAATGLYLIRGETSSDDEVPKVTLAKCEYDEDAAKTIWKHDGEQLK